MRRIRRDEHGSRPDAAGGDAFDMGQVEEAVRPAEAATPPVRDLSAERRLRASGGPDDRANYTCGCGYVFEARVSTSVRCPNCGRGQAW